MDNKVCRICKTNKSINLYDKQSKSRDGHRGECMECRREYCRQRRIKNNLIINAKASVYRKKNKLVNGDKIKEYKRLYYLRNKKHINEKSKVWRANNKKRNIEIKTAWVKRKRKEDLFFKLKDDLRRSIYTGFKEKKIRKPSNAEKILGCTFSFAKKHIERQFTKGMTWDNHGNGEGKWNIDHKIPVASAKNKEDLISIFHYTNLQPLWSKENKEKKDKILPFQLSLTI